MTMSQTLQALLEQLPQDEQLEFNKLLEAIYKVRFTGPLLIDFLNGLPQQINLGPPVRLSICHGQRTSLPTKLERRSGSQTASQPLLVDKRKPVSTG